MKQFWTRFLEVAGKYPNAIAVQEGGKTLTYMALATLAADIGENLKQKGVVAEMPVALELEKSADYIAALLGCWYAGAAFVPLPPSLPQERRDYIMCHADIRHTVSMHDMKSSHWGEFNPARVDADTLAYIIYTSGSTGAPKGVMVEHRGIVNFIDAQIESFKTGCGSRYLFYLSILFDAAISDIGVCLLSGSTLVIEPPDVLRDGSRLVKRLQKLRITHMDMPPSLLKTLSPGEMPDSLETVIIGGEACPPDVVRRWARKFRVVNVYGPTEATVCTSLCLCDPVRWKKPLIGESIAGIEYFILDEELYIGGIGLARGYLKQPELTDQKFIRHAGRRLYKTGDKVRWHEDGSIEFLGRIDRQFKLRGQLVEPDEIEARLLADPSIRKAAVLKRDERLVAFIVADKGISASGIEIRLKKFLPAWMIPQHFEVMDDFPLTATGKTDFAALRVMPLQGKVVSGRVPPSTQMEKKIWHIWRDILKHENFGITDDFFAVGGDSLGIIRMTLETERQGLPFISASLAERRTIEKLARAAQAEARFLSCDFLKEDVAFDEEWQGLFSMAQERPYPPETAPKNIFLTGAAGFLGGRLLRELLEKTEADIYCLIRPENTKMKLSNLRIKILRGDLTRPYFGLDKSVWEALTEKIEAVYHCAARVNMILPYHDLRAANVGATREVLRLTCAGRRKHLHHASTLSVFVATDRNEGRLMETDRLENTQRVYGGYAQTKWAAEWMLLQVPKEACAITHYRFGLITGDTKTGVCSDTDFLTMFARGMASLGTTPEEFDDKLYVDITPVDYAAAAMAHLSLCGEHAIYHIANPRSLSLGRLLAAMERKGAGIKRLPVRRWKDVMDNKSVTAEETAAGFSLCRCLPEEFDKHRVMDLFQATGVVFYTTHTDADLQARCPEASDALLDIYMETIFRGRNKPIKICIFGPESTGKSTLAQKLAEHYKTSFAPEFAKDLIFSQVGNITLEDIPRIARGQIKNEMEAAAHADRLLFCDTDLITTAIWSDRLFGECPQWIRDAAGLQDYDLYLLMDVDAPWVADVHRFLPEERESFLEKCRQELDKSHVKYITLSGSWDKKFGNACREVDKISGEVSHDSQKSVHHRGH